MGPSIEKNTDSYRLKDKRAMAKDWVHDKYRADSPDHKGEIVGSRRGDLYDGPGKRRVRSTDSYKPGIGDFSNHRDDSRDSFRPLPRDSHEHPDDARHGVHKPNAYYQSILGDIVDKAFAVGITAESFCGAYYWCGGKVKKDKPTASAYWLLWRQECMMWKQFFPSQGFIGAEPKLKPTTRDTEPTNFTLLDGSKLWSVFRASPTYGRLTKETDLGSSIPAAASTLPKKPQPITTSSSSSSSSEYQNNLQHPSQLASSSNSTHNDQNNTQILEQLKTKAIARNVSAGNLQAIYQGKRRLAKDHYSSDQNKEWQNWFVEATVWGHLFKDAPFPGREPRFYHRSGDNGQITNPALDENFVFLYAPQEKVMEQMAIKRGIRREFFQYLNRTRHDAIAVHPLCTCYARNFLADRLTWRKFFKEQFPVAWPSQDHSKECHANVQIGPFPPQTQVITAPPTSSTARVREREAIAQGLQRPVATIELPPKSTIVESQEPEAVVLSPQSSTTIVKASAESQCASYSPGFASTQAPAPTSNPLGQRFNINFLPAKPSQPLQGKSSTLAGVRVEENKAESTPREVAASPAREFREIPPPMSVLTALAQARNSTQIPDGALVMQNMDVTICNSESVAQMFRCLQAENAASILSISDGLKCHFRYRRQWNGDLMLWIEPYILGDTAAFSGGHFFLKGWVQRNLGFGVVQPSFYRNEIYSHPNFKKAATTTASTGVHDGMSPTNSDTRSGISSARNVDGATDNTEQNVNGVLIVRGAFLEIVPCSRAALKNLAYSFVIDSSKEKVEQRLRCSFSLNESNGPNKTGGTELDLAVRRPVSIEDKEFEKATRFLRAWALRAMQNTPCKPSTFLVCPEGLFILGKSPPAIPANGVSEKRSGEREITRSSFNASDLDLLLSEETAKAEGSSRLVLDEVTGEVASLRELLKKTLYRASAKISEFSTIVEDEDDDEEEEVKVFGTDGQMKDMGGGKFVVVNTQKRFEVASVVSGKRKMEEDATFGERVEKRVCTSSDKVPEYQKSSEVVPVVGVTGGTKQIGVDEPAAIPMKNDSRVIETSELANGKRKAEEVLLKDYAEQNGVHEPAPTPLKNGSVGVETFEHANRKRKAEEVELEDRDEKRVCV